MQLILFRHGPAGRPDAARWPDDRARPLSPRGEEKTRAAARGLARLLPAEATIWSSPLVRAARTAEILAHALDNAPVREVAALAAGAAQRPLLALLTAAFADDNEGRLVLVGHEPDLGLLAGALLGDPARSLPLKKAGACALSFDSAPGPGRGRLDWFLPPRLLRALGARARASQGKS